MAIHAGFVLIVSLLIIEISQYFALGLTPLVSLLGELILPEGRLVTAYLEEVSKTWRRSSYCLGSLPLMFLVGNWLIWALRFLMIWRSLSLSRFILTTIAESSARVS